MRITIDLPLNKPTLDNATELVYAVRFAINEYIEARTPATKYVNERYAHLDDVFRNNKLPRVHMCLDALMQAEINADMNTLHLTAVTPETYRTDGFFRSLDANEVRQFREAAREKYVKGDPINPVWHPVYRDECERINKGE